MENAVAKDWSNVSLDKERLVEENEERKSVFFDDIKLLNQLEKYRLE